MAYVGIGFVLALHGRVLHRFLEPSEGLLYVTAGELKALLVLVKDQHRHLAVAQDRQLLRFLEQSLLSLHERHLPLARLRDRADRDLLSLHRPTPLLRPAVLRPITIS